MACTRVEVAEPPAPPSLAEAGAAGQPGGGSGSLPGLGGEGGQRDEVDSGGQPGKLELGVWPTFVADPSRAREVQEVSAAVAALALGSTTLPLYEPWDSLSGASGALRSATRNRLDSLIAPYGARRGKVALCVGIVNRESPAWPFSDALESDAAQAAMRRTIDELYARYAGLLSHLCFGYELDRYLAVASSSARRQLLAFLQQTIAYATEHPLHGSTAVGAAISLGALSGAAEAPLAELMLGEEVVAVYDPLDAAARPKAPAAVADELRAALDGLSAAGGRLPLSLFEVGYPSAAVGSSEQDQLAYFDALFEVLAAQSDRLSFVGVFGLGDRAATDCEAEAGSFGSAGAAEAKRRALARCSMGLRAESDTEKPALAEVLAAISRYR